MTKDKQEVTELGVLEEIAASLREVLLLTRVVAYPSVKQTLETLLDSPEKRRVYDATDGQRSTAQIQELSRVNTRFVSEWGQEWEKMGIVVQSRTSDIKGRREKLFDLALFGLAPAKVEAAKEPEDQESKVE